MNFTIKIKKTLFLFGLLFLTILTSFAGFSDEINKFDGLRRIIDTISEAERISTGEKVHQIAQDAIASFEKNLPCYQQNFECHGDIETQLTKVISLIKEINTAGTKTKPWKLDAVRKEVQKLIVAIDENLDRFFLNDENRMLQDLYDNMQGIYDFVLNSEYVTVGNRFERIGYRIVNKIRKHKVRTGIALSAAALLMIVGLRKSNAANYQEIIDQGKKDKLPIVYSEEYNIVPGKIITDIASRFGITIGHSFDGEKYRKVQKYLKDNFGLSDGDFFKPPKISEEVLKLIHTSEYIQSLKDSKTVANITEIPGVQRIPNFFVQKQILNPMRKQTSGTILGAFLALKKGWAINLGGGFHHAKKNKGSGFCVYADINIAVQKLWEKYPDKKIMIVDTDYHQGNGYAEIFRKDVYQKGYNGTFANEKRVSIFDIYRSGMLRGRKAFPSDEQAKECITFDHPVFSSINDEEYLKILKINLPKALKILGNKNQKPDLIIYNAGTDIFKEDKIGDFEVTAEGIKQRDQFVFELAKKNNIPILWLFSGGYSKKSELIIGHSIENAIKNVWNIKAK